MAVKQCCYDTALMALDFQIKSIYSVIFIPFSKANQDTEKYKGWIQACSRQNFDILSITKYTFVCSAHFVQDQGHSDSFKFILNHHISVTTAV